MTLYQRLERKLGRYAVPNLMKYICVMYAVGFLIQLSNPLFYYYYLDLDPEAILHGHIWRILTFLFYFPSRNPLWAILGIWVYYSLGQTLERIWGTFKYNFFFWTGVFLLVLGSLLAYLFTGISFQLDPTYMNFSIFLVYALTFPNATFLLYFLIPIQAKYLAIFEAVLYGIFFFQSLLGGDFGGALAILLSFLNVGLFYYLTTRKPRRRGNTIDINAFR